PTADTLRAGSPVQAAPDLRGAPTHADCRVAAAVLPPPAASARHPARRQVPRQTAPYTRPPRRLHTMHGTRALPAAATTAGSLPPPDRTFPAPLSGPATAPPAGSRTAYAHPLPAAPHAAPVPPAPAARPRTATPPLPRSAAIPPSSSAHSAPVPLRSPPP